MKKNKKTLIIVLVSLLIVSLFLFFMIDKNKNSKNLVMSCDGDAVSNEHLSLDMFIKVYEKDTNIYFNKVLEIEKISNSEKINKMVDILLQMNSYGKLKDYITFETEGNKTRLNLYVNLSELSNEDLEYLFHTTDISIDSIKKYIEEGDMICQKH